MNDHNHDHHHGRGPGPNEGFGEGHFGSGDHAGPRFLIRSGWGGAGRAGGGWGGPPGAGRGRRMRRGNIRPLLLTSLLEGPAHGYEIISRLEERSSGVWKPSPGSVYPMLQLLSDEGVVSSTEAAGKRTYELTETGRAEAETSRASGVAQPWDDDPSAGGRVALRGAVIHLIKAAKQVGEAGGPDEVEKALEIVRQARQGLYKILAEA